MMAPNTPPDKSPIDTLVEEFKSILGPQYSSLMISNKWMAKNNPNDYFILSFSGQVLRLLERSATMKNEYELQVKTGALKVNNENKDRSFAMSFLDKIDKISGLLTTNKAELFFKSKDDGNERPHTPH